VTMGEYIKRLRMGENKYGRKFSQHELGQMLNPPVYRSAVNKWESGEVVNIKRSHIEQLAEIFGILPIDLMCFDSKYDGKRISEEIAAVEAVHKLFGRQAVLILQYFDELNDIGKEKILDDIMDMVQLPKYKGDIPS